MRLTHDNLWGEYISSNSSSGFPHTVTAESTMSDQAMYHVPLPLHDPVAGDMNVGNIWLFFLDELVDLQTWHISRISTPDSPIKLKI